MVSGSLRLCCKFRASKTDIHLNLPVQDGINLPAVQIIGLNHHMAGKPVK